MSVLDKLFGRKPNKKEEVPPLQQTDEPTEMKPEDAANAAELFVDAVKQTQDLELDYSPESLEFIDNFMKQKREHTELSFERNKNIFLLAGCYVGQVMVLHNGAKWIKTKDTQLNSISEMPLVIKMPNGWVVNPIGKVFKCFEEDDSVVYFYEFATKEVKK